MRNWTAPHRDNQFSPWLCILSVFTAWLLSPLYVRNLPVLLVLLASTIGLASLIWRSKGMAHVVYGALALATLSAFSPIDVSGTSGDSLSIRIVPIVYTVAKVSDLQAEGNKLGRDFVHYRGFPLLNRARMTLLLTMKRWF
jgi:hypothetical protein